MEIKLAFLCILSSTVIEMFYELSLYNYFLNLVKKNYMLNKPIVP